MIRTLNLLLRVYRKPARKPESHLRKNRTSKKHRKNYPPVDFQI